jgi:Zn-dependent oligopeptidase
MAESIVEIPSATCITLFLGKLVCEGMAVQVKEPGVSGLENEWGFVRLPSQANG